MRVLILLLAISVFGCAKETIISTEDIALEISKRLNVGIDNITVTDLGLTKFYEVSLSSGEVFYSDAKAEKLIIGRLIDKENNDLTAKKEDGLIKVKVKKIESIINLDKAVRIGNGSIKVIEFTDVDCPFCFRAEGFFAGRDVSRYIYFTPLDELHPEAEKRSIHILCSDNKSLEYERVINNQVTDYKSCSDGAELLKLHRGYGKIAGVTGTPHFIINSKMIIGADPKILDELGAK